MTGEGFLHQPGGRSSVKLLVVLFSHIWQHFRVSQNWLKKPKWYLWLGIPKRPTHVCKSKGGSKGHMQIESVCLDISKSPQIKIYYRRRNEWFCSKGFKRGVLSPYTARLICENLKSWYYIYSEIANFAHGESM